MGQQSGRLLCLVCAFLLPSAAGLGQKLELKNELLVAEISSRGLESVRDLHSGLATSFSADGWSLTLDEDTLKSSTALPTVTRTGSEGVILTYALPGYNVEAIYRLRAGWHFVSKQLRIIKAPHGEFTVHRVGEIETLREEVSSHWIPSTYLPQFGATMEESQKMVPTKDFGAFLRFGNRQAGLMFLVQNPYLEVHVDGQSTELAYSPEMQWRQEWGDFESDIACIGPYHLSGQFIAQAMVPQWQVPTVESAPQGADLSEVAAFSDCVRSFLVHPSSAPISVEVGWTLNDYQIDVATPQGKAEYQRIIDATAELGIHTLVYSASNSMLASVSEDTDSWHWEHTLWLNLGQKIRKGGWDPTRSPVPAEVAEMVAYAKKKDVGLLAYVYPSVPYERNPSWLVTKGTERYATLASRDLQDYLIRMLISFKQRTGIAGYSFDYAWLNVPGSSSYAQWWGWRRVMEGLRRADPSIVIDGRQSYQEYGPWSWLAGSYPHPTGNDEQPESFLPYPDLHFDRVSADRTRFVNYWYRNYQFAPEQLIPGYATHQTERSVNIPVDSVSGGTPARVKLMETAYRLRDWDYLGYRYSFLSSIATGGWNNVVDMIPARDSEEYRHFSPKDKTWIREWLAWTVEHKEYLQHTRTILSQPEMDGVDGTSAIVGNHGYLFLFNPNYRSLPVKFRLDSSIGLASGQSFLLRELYPQRGRIIGKRDTGLWSSGDVVQLPIDGTSATALEIYPVGQIKAPVILNALPPSETQGTAVRASLANGTLTLKHVAGEPGTDQEIGVLLPVGEHVTALIVNGQRMRSEQTGNYVSCHVHFSGIRFAQAQQVPLKPTTGGDLSGAFVVPARIFEQLAERKKAWPIPWTKEDYETTWLAPERLLLFIQPTSPRETMQASATLDGNPLPVIRAYTSVRVHPADFVGFYADLSKIKPDSEHTLRVKVTGIVPEELQGVFFDNVEPQSTEEISAVGP